LLLLTPIPFNWFNLTFPFPIIFAFLIGMVSNKRSFKSLTILRKGKIKPVKWNWGQEQQVARERLIEVLTSSPILAYADYSLPFLLDIDASGNGLGAVLHPLLF
jgi:hypothetical protein